MNWEKFDRAEVTFDLNYMLIPVNLYQPTDEGMKAFNEILEATEGEGLSQMIRTKSSGISISGKNFIHNCHSLDISSKRSGVEVVAVFNGYAYRFQFRAMKPKGRDISGSRSYAIFHKLIKKICNVDLDDYKIKDREEAKSVKMTIEKPSITLRALFKDTVLENVHHLDLHNAHMSGVAFYHPELAPAVRYCRKKRKTDEIFKAILTHFWGYCQSEYIGYSLSQLSKDGIHYTNETINDLCKRLEDSGRIVIATNTDGIWYQGEIYHGEGEGDDIMQWSNDYVNCKFRARSKGCYEFEGWDCGKKKYMYKPVVRGLTNYDEIQPDRTKWQWGDIYKTGSVKKYVYDKDTNRIRLAKFEELDNEYYTLEDI